MATSAGKAHCTWCGAVITGGRRFCAACGEPVVEDDDDDEPEARAWAAPAQSQKFFTDALDVEKDQSQGLMGKLGSGLATAVGIPLAIVLGLISIVISTALPVLVVMALIMGPGDTWDMVSAWIPGRGNDNLACAGFDDWYEKSAERSQQVVRMLEEVNVQTASPAELRSLATEVDALTAEQRRSNPPQEAVVLNGMMVETLALGADALRDIASGDQSGVQYFVDESSRLTPIYDAEEERVFEACR